LKLGFIGLGNIGAPLARHLLDDGHQLVVLDRDPARAARLVEAGAEPASAPSELARRCEIGFLSLPDPGAVAAVAGAWLTGAAEGSVLVDLSTNSPQAVRELGVRVAARGCRLLEAPLTGGAPGAAARKLVFLVGGEAEVFERCRPLLERLSRAVFYFGPLGLGNTAKLVNSLLAFTATWVSLEGLSIAAKAGIDLRTLLDAIRAGGAGNFYTDRAVEGIGRRGREPQFALALAAKDARLISELARDEGVPAPIAAQIEQVLASALEAGLGERDWSDLVELAERSARVALELAPAKR
jgi:3-hydroxyisobutyrate dehydrogenase-like beta-hydroxyacid dehydrogenase